MIAALRRRHRLFWRIFTPLLIVGAVSGYLMAPEFPVDTFRAQKVTYTELVKSVVTENYVFNWRRNYSGENVIEIEKISSINPVTQLVILIRREAGGEKITPLGIMGSESSHLFKPGLFTPPFKILVIDTIKNQPLGSAEF
jgi:hypothetical protein